MAWPKIFGEHAKKPVSLPSAPRSDDGQTTFPLSMIKKVVELPSSNGTYLFRVSNNAGTDYWVKSANAPDLLDNAGEQVRIEDAVLTRGDHNQTAKRIAEALSTYEYKKGVAAFVSKPDDKSTLAPIAIILQDSHYKELSAQQVETELQAFAQMGIQANFLYPKEDQGRAPAHEEHFE